MASRAIPAHNGPPAKGAPSESPNASLYVTNLPEKIHKPDLRLSLYTLFSTYGPVLDVVAMKTKKMRGQAHVVFRDIPTSSQAMRALQGFDFFGKELKIQYAKSKSNVFQRLEGVYRAQDSAAEASSTDARQALFNAPLAAATTGPPSSLPPKPLGATTNGTKPGDEGSQGVKRRREDESDEEDAPMEEDDDDVSMEASSDED
ncbi:U2 snRNP complex subunit msl1 [Thelotrema lepadinum]|nr:U2 snRNP complex subunit msl1 [Thelotrema lepadinum]